MDKLREAAQQALDYMKSVGQTDMYAEEWAIVGNLEAALAEQQEPVAWGMPRSDGAIIDCISPEEHAHLEGDYTVPLYAAPQPRREVELTDEEIDRALDAANVPELPDGYKSVELEIARAVIAAYKAKQGETK